MFSFTSSGLFQAIATVAVSTLCASASALPNANTGIVDVSSSFNKRFDIVPPIIIPNNKTVWKVGGIGVVSWKTDQIPSYAINQTGFANLGVVGDELGILLAKDFLLTDGAVGFFVPDVPPRDDYQVVLFGDSGNLSPAFEITD